MKESLLLPGFFFCAIIAYVFEKVFLCGSLRERKAMSNIVPTVITAALVGGVSVAVFCVFDGTKWLKNFVAKYRR